MAIATGRTLADVFGLSAAEFAVWAAFAQRHGFPADRGEWASAIAGAAVAQTFGGKVRARELVPKFGPRETSLRQIVAYFDGLTPERFNGGK